VHDAPELFSLLLIQNLFHAGLTGGADFVHLRLEHLIVHGEIVEDRFDFGSLIGGELELFLEAVEGYLLTGIVPGEGFDGLGGGAIDESASDGTTEEYEAQGAEDLRILPRLCTASHS